jgi:hypothetical protein
VATPQVPSSPRTASVNITQLAQIVQTQQCEQWCWAACISMLFNFYGHPLSQQRIVMATYGNIVCWPSGLTIGQDVNRDYIDERGVRFSSRVVAAYDAAFNINTLTNQMIVDAISNNQPLLYCNRRHAMVMYSITYTPTAFQPDVHRVEVIDPWPFNLRTRALSPSEMVPAHVGGDLSFLAQIRVT